MLSDCLQMHCFLHFPKAPLVLLCSPLLVSNCPSMQLLPYEYKLPCLVAIAEHICVCVCARVRKCRHELIHQHLRDWTDKQLCGCQHSTLISPWWIEWKTCLILFFLLVAALIDLQQHWNQYRIALFHSIESQHTFCFDMESTPLNHTILSFSNLSVLIYFKGASK